MDHELPGEAGAEPEGSDEDERDAAIQDALMELKPDHRAVLILKHFEEQSYEEVAQILNISVKKVKSRLFAARLVLRQILLRKGVVEND